MLQHKRIVHLQNVTMGIGPDFIRPKFKICYAPRFSQDFYRNSYSSNLDPDLTTAREMVGLETMISLKTGQIVKLTV